jgi:hypothetical protein
MSGELARRIMASRQNEAAAEPEGGEDTAVPCWSFLRGLREQSLMFEIRLRDGRREAFKYTWLEHAVFDPSEGITLHFGRKKVQITGRNLNAEVRPNLRLFDCILRHRVPWVQEAAESEALAASQHAVVIEQVRLE